MIRILRVACLLSLLVTSGCGTLMNGSRQSITVEVEPPGATVLLYPDRTRSTAPAVLELDRKRVYTLLIERPGYQPEWIYLDRAGSPWIYGDVLFLPLFPALLYVDTRSGGAYVLRPARVRVEMRQPPETIPDPHEE